jgi:hypothetical protein
MASAPPNPTQLTPPRVAVIDERTGAISREWYRFFLSLLTSSQATTAATETQPDANSLMATYDAMLASLAQEVQTNTSDLTASLQQQINDVFNATAVTPPSSGGTVTSVDASGGSTGMVFTGGPITTSGTLTLSGTLNVVNGGTGQTSYTDGQLLIGNTTGNTLTKSTLTAGTAISITNGAGSITITNTAPDQIVSLTAGTGISISGTYPSFTITNTLPDQIVSLTGAGTTVVTGTYPSFTITSNDAYVGTVTSVSGTGTVNGITFTGTVTSSGSLTLGGTLSGVSLTSQVTGILPVANGGTGTATAFTAGSVVFAGASGIYSQDNANFFWDDANNRLGVGNASPGATLDVTGNIRLSAANPNIELNNGGPMVYSPGVANTLSFATGGGPSTPVERFRIGSAGQWGIGGATYGTAGQVFTSGGALAAPTWTTPTTGTVTSVSGTGTVNGITLTGTVTTSGSLTLGGTLGGIANSQLTNSSITINGSAISLGGSVSVGTVTSVGGTGTVNGITLTGTVTSSGSLTLGGTLSGVSLTTQVSGTLPVGNGGTGATTFTSGYLLKGNGGSAISVSVAYDNGSQILIGTTTGTAASVSGLLQVESEIISKGSLAGFFFENRSGGVTAGSNWFGWYNSGGTTFFYNPAVGNIASINSATGAYTALSDAAKKKDFEPSAVGLDAVLALKPTLFRMDTDADDAPKQLGFVAQEVKDHIPQAYVEEQNTDAGGNESTYIGLNDRPIIAALVKAVQDLKAEIDELKR